MNFSNVKVSCTIKLDCIRVVIFKMSTEKKVDVEVIKEVPELEGLEDLVKKVIDIDIFGDEDSIPPYAEAKKGPNQTQQQAKNTLISVLLDTTRQMNQKIAR